MMGESSSSVVLPNGLPAHHFRIHNGLELYVVENHAAPVFTYQIWFKVGSREEKLDPRIQATGLAHLFEHMMFRGTTNYGDGEFDRILTRNGVFDENATTWLDRTNFYESLPRDKLELVIKLESDRMVNLVIDKEILDTEREAVIGELHMEFDDPDMVAYNKLYENAFTIHPYRYTTIGTEEEIRSFTKEKADYFYRTYYSPNNAVIIVAGDVDPQEVVSLVAKYYGAIREQPVPKLDAPSEPAQTAERVVEFRHEQITETKLLLGWHTPRTMHADIAPLLVTESLLTTGEGALLENIWVNQGLAVGISGTLNLFRDPGLLIVGADLQEGKSPTELLNTLDLSLNALAAEIKPGELERARNQLLLGIYQQWEDNGSLASYMGEFITSAASPLHAFTMVKEIEKVSAADVRRVIATYLIPTNRTVVIGQPENL